MTLTIGPSNKTILNLGWNQSTDTYTPTTTKNTINSVHLKMKR